MTSGYSTNTTTLKDALAEFLAELGIRNRSQHTRRLYRDHVERFIAYAEKHNAGAVGDVSAAMLRGYFEQMQETHNPGGVHLHFRSIRAWLFWFWTEYEITTPCPIKKINLTPPRVKPKNGADPDTVEALVSVCRGREGLRDKTLFLFLLDTGVRASECCSINLADVDMARSSVVIRMGKGNRQRVVYFGKRVKRLLRVFLAARASRESVDPLFVTDRGERMNRNTIQQIIRRRCAEARVPPFGPHDFRRAFGLQMLRNGVSVVTISRLLGHASLEITMRYIAQEAKDFQDDIAKGSPADHLHLN